MLIKRGGIEVDGNVSAIGNDVAFLPRETAMFSALFFFAKLKWYTQ
ncbi:hypothetical protein [Herbaspirillum sp.]|nr:hypothetical protein [Herbaspirillum sp.]MBO9538387.1 hypothetical protein [Herbaspirillum sp.]